MFINIDFEYDTVSIADIVAYDNTGKLTLIVEVKIS